MYKRQVQNGARIKLNSRVKSVVVSGGRAVGVDTFAGKMNAGAVIIATGGASYPKTGSTGDGYTMARDLGHSIVRPQPALSALLTREPWVKRLQGLSLRCV